MEPLQTLAPSGRSTSPLAPRSLSGRRIKASSVFQNSRSGQENTPPNNPNIQINPEPVSSLPKKPFKQIAVSFAGESPSLAASKDGSALPSDDSVKVVIRIRPDQEKGAHLVVKCTASDTVLVGGRTYSFDSILDSASSQEDVFNLVGVPLVKNSLAGFNNSIICHGHSGTGKTYTMWGPPSAMVDGGCIKISQGIVPRIFQMLFAEILKNKESSEYFQTNFQFRCSFLEIYNEQINDLLDPTIRNIRVRDDAKNAFQIENLSEEYVNTMEDVTQLLVKGLSNRKVGATSVNSKSSRSHIMFTCVIESWCKGLSSKFFSSSKTSRINFVDLAGIDSYKVDGFSRHSIQEDRFIKQSLSKLGRLINFLSSDSNHLENFEKVPHFDSCLTTVLQDTLGGNAKVTFICAVFPEERYKAATLSTLRFGGLAKQMRNKAMINEISEDDVNELSDQIRQLKEELIRAKSCESSPCWTNGRFKRQNTRESLIHLRRSLNRSLLLPLVDNEPEIDMDVDEEDVRELWVQLEELHSSVEEPAKKSVGALLSDGMLYAVHSSENQPSSPTDPEADVYSIPGNNNELQEESSEAPEIKKPDKLDEVFLMESNQIQISKATVLERDVCTSPANHESKRESPDEAEIESSSNVCKPSPQVEKPVFCASPPPEATNNSLRKSSSKLFNTSESPKFSVAEKESVNKTQSIRSSLQSSKISPIESLAASLHRGLQIIDYHQQNSASSKPTVGLSLEHLSSISYQPGVNKVNICVQKDDNAPPVLCSACKRQVTGIVRQNNDEQIIPFENSEPVAIEANQQVLLLEGGINASDVVHQRNAELESLCGEQALKIKDLDSQIDQFKSVCNHGSGAEQNRSALESSKEALLAEIQSLKAQLKSKTCTSMSISLLEQIRNGGTQEKREEFESEKERWMESESRWISLTEELRMDLESNRRMAEKLELELSLEKQCTAELDDALLRSMQSHARMIEHYAELQEKHSELVAKHRKVMEGIAEVKKAAEKAGSKQKGSAFAAALAAELATSRVEREKERTYLKEQNRVLKLQLRDTAEAVQAAGELLVRLKEAEEAVSVTEEKYGQAQQETERLRRQIEKLKRKHTMEIATMKHCLAGSRLPESALEPLYHRRAFENVDQSGAFPPDDMSWRSAFKSEL